MIILPGHDRQRRPQSAVRFPRAAAYVIDHRSVRYAPMLIRPASVPPAGSVKSTASSALSCPAR